MFHHHGEATGWATRHKKEDWQKKEKSGLTEVQRRHQAKVEQRWEEEAEKKKRDSHRGMDAKIERMEEAEGAAIAAARAISYAVTPLYVSLAKAGRTLYRRLFS